MHVHDYTRVGFYMITILTADRRRLFGVCTDGRTQLSEAGEIVRRRWQEIPAHRPAIETNTLNRRHYASMAIDDEATGKNQPHAYRKETGRT